MQLCKRRWRGGSWNSEDEVKSWRRQTPREMQWSGNNDLKVHVSIKVYNDCLKVYKNVIAMLRWTGCADEEVTPNV
jgi:hypothetical protein